MARMRKRQVETEGYDDELELVSERRIPARRIPVKHWVETEGYASDREMVYAEARERFAIQNQEPLMVPNKAGRRTTLALNVVGTAAAIFLAFRVLL